MVFTMLAFSPPRIAGHFPLAPRKAFDTKPSATASITNTIKLTICRDAFIVKFARFSSYVPEQVVMWSAPGCLPLI